MNHKSILVVDDEAFMRKNIVDLLSSKECKLVESSSGEEALEMLREHRFDLILLDINLPGKSGFEILTEIKQSWPDIPVIIFTAFGTSEKAIEAMKKGAHDYLEKPFELDEFLLIVERALEYSELMDEVMELRYKVSSISDTDELQIIGNSPQMREIFKMIGRVSPADATVLIHGDSGTGKELIANAVQRHSNRSDKAYVKVNCGGLSESVLESEIFGHEKGSFTGAVAQRMGRFELADNGTIFLDEIDSMPPSLQVRLLRVLQQQAFFRVGGEEQIRTDVRVIAATNKDLEAEVEAGRFREDLFYRFNVVRIFIPPLAERREDIPLLVNHFLKKYSPEKKLIVPPAEMDKLLSYGWPGNVRELENAIQSAVVMARENILTIENLSSSTAKEGENIQHALEEWLSDGYSLKEILANIEKELILSALNSSAWNRTEAAKGLKIHRRQLYSKMLEYNIIDKSDQ